MEKRILALPFLLVAVCAVSQPIIVPQTPGRKPYFESAADSALFEQFYGPRFGSLLMSIRDDGKKLDSVNTLRDALLKKAKGTRILYEPSSSFTAWDKVCESGHFENELLISFSSNKYSKLPKEVMNCKNLVAIELVNTRIRRIPKKLSQIQSLKTVLIYNSARPFKMGKNASLKTLVVRGGKNPAHFAQLPNLERLDLSLCNLTALPKKLERNKKLKELILNENTINLSSQSGKPSYSLTKLEMQSNQLTEIPDAITSFPNLKIAVFNKNKIASITPRISELTKLEQIGLYTNKLQAIPDGIFQLQALKDIDLYFNEIERVDDRVGNLTNLEVLYLSHNKIISISESIGNLTKLQQLYLSSNRLSDLPLSLKNLHDLKVLRINNNYLTQVSVDLLKLNELENIDISNNKITELPEGAVSLQQLKLLVMLNNPWDTESKERLPYFIEQLRKREVVVHAN